MLLWPGAGVGVVVPGAGQVIVCHGHPVAGCALTARCRPDLPPPPLTLTRPTFFSRCCPGKTDQGSGNWMMTGMLANYQIKGVSHIKFYSMIYR